MEIIICSNCEKEIAVYECINCEKNENYYCFNCWNIHLKVKIFKEHKNKEINLICNNCERNKAIKQCNDCNIQDSLFCKECEVVHKQVKLSRSHTFKNLMENQNQNVNQNSNNNNNNNNNNNEKKSILDSCLESKPPKDKNKEKNNEKKEILNKTSRRKFKNFDDVEVIIEEKPVIPSNSNKNNQDFMMKILDQLYVKFLYLFKYFDTNIEYVEMINWIPESLSEIFGSELDFKTISFGLLVAFIIHAIIKFLLGKNSIYVVVAVGVLGVRWLKRNQTIIVKEIKKIDKENAAVFDEMKTLRTKSNMFLSDEKEDLSEEFWHTKEVKEQSKDSSAIFVPQFKPRGPLYQRKVRNQNQNQNSSDNNQVENQETKSS